MCKVVAGAFFFSACLKGSAFARLLHPQDLPLSMTPPRHELHCTALQPPPVTRATPHAGVALTAPHCICIELHEAELFGAAAVPAKLRGASDGLWSVPTSSSVVVCRCSCIHLKCAGSLYWVLGLHVIILGGKRHVSLFPPRVLHTFVHAGKTSCTFRLDARTDFRGRSHCAMCSAARP